MTTEIGAKNLPAPAPTRNGPTRPIRMEIRVYPDPALRRGGKTVSDFGPEIQQTADAMLESMYEGGGVGLAAPQVGIEHKLLVLNPTGSKDDREGELCLLNPKVTRKKGREFGEEGCLSFPGIQAEVERWVKITITYQDLDGKEQTMSAEDWLARIIQHEIDHLEGVLFTDRLTPTDKMRVKTQLTELEDKFRAQA